MKTVVLTDRPANALRHVEIEAISTLMNEMIDRAKAGDIEIGLNALLGAYFNLAVSEGRAAKAAKALVSAAAAADRIAAGAKGPAAVAPEPANSQVDLAVAATVSLSNRIQGVLVGQPHHHALSALLNLFIQGATDNACCTAECARVATDAGRLLAERAAALGQSATVH